jgi:acetyl esterase
LPVTDVAADNQSRRDFAQGYFLEGPLMSWAGTHCLLPDVDVRDSRLSLLRAPDLSGLPPVASTRLDSIRCATRQRRIDALERAGVEVHYTCHEHMIHHFYAMAGAIPYTRTALKSVGAEIKAALAPLETLSLA